MIEQTKPQALEDAALDEASGGLPAVQKVREAANRANAGDGSVMPGGIQAILGDGSVRTL